jgi:hypothetical protein
LLMSPFPARDTSFLDSLEQREWLFRRTNLARRFVKTSYEGMAS